MFVVDGCRQITKLLIHWLQAHNRHCWFRLGYAIATHNNTASSYSSGQHARSHDAHTIMSLPHVYNMLSCYNRRCYWWYCIIFAIQLSASSNHPKASTKEISSDRTIASHRVLPSLYNRRLCPFIIPPYHDNAIMIVSSSSAYYYY